VIEVSPIPLEHQIIPLLYQDMPIDRQAALKIIEKGSKLPRQNFPGLTYRPEQAPTPGSNYVRNNWGWNKVLCSPTTYSNSSPIYKIKIFQKDSDQNTSFLIGVILVHFLSIDGVPLSVQKASTYYMNNHLNVRETKHESSLIVPIGLRFDPRLAAIVNYQKSLQKESTTAQNVG